MVVKGLDLKNETDDFLIEVIGMKDDFPQDAKQAYGLLYERYWESMLYIARGVCKGHKDLQAEAEDLIANTFSAIYEKAGSFNKGKLKSSEKIRCSILSWMTTIMKNEFFDNHLDQPTKERILKENKDKKDKNINLTSNLENEHIIDVKSISKHFNEIHEDLISELEENESFHDFEDEESSNKIKNIEYIENYLKTLPEREADIIRETYMFYVPGKNTPSEVLDYLENRWSTTRDNIRRILKKFRDRIKSELKEKIIIRR